MAVSGLYPYRSVPRWEVGPGRVIMAPRAGLCWSAGQAGGSGNPAATNPMANPRVEATYARAMAAFQEGSFDLARRLIGEILIDDPGHAGARALRTPRSPHVVGGVRTARLHARSRLDPLPTGRTRKRPGSHLGRSHDPHRPRVVRLPATGIHRTDGRRSARRSPAHARGRRAATAAASALQSAIEVRACARADDDDASEEVHGVRVV